MNTITPKNLAQGDTVGIVCPSRHIYGEAKTINRAANWLKRNGLKVKFGPNAKARQFDAAGNRYQRADDINSFFIDKQIKAIFCAIGGDAANQTLDLLDYDQIKANPKPIIGYSDNTNLLLAIYSQTGLMTFHGPNLIQIPTITKTAKQQLINTLFKNNGTYNYNFKVLKPGIAKGKLIGGNLMIINNLTSTIYSPDYTGTILFWEDINEGESSLEYQLYQLHLSGILGKISGIVIGHIVQTSQGDARPYQEIILELTRQYQYPIIKTDFFGHDLKRFFTFPIGTDSFIDTDRKIFQFS
jgi:muramoyltetrapeptide carboxypeptidase